MNCAKSQFLKTLERGSFLCPVSLATVILETVMEPLKLGEAVHAFSPELRLVWFASTVLSTGLSSPTLLRSLSWYAELAEALPKGRTTEPGDRIQ